MVKFKFGSFEEKITDYQIRCLALIKNPDIKETRALSKARLDIIKRINVGLDGFLTFSQSIHGSFISKSVRMKNSKFHSDSILKKLSDFELAGQSNEVKIKFIKEQIKFVSNMFTPEKLKLILDELFEGFEFG